MKMWHSANFTKLKIFNMSHFTPAFVKFFKELAKYNHKEWFDEHRKIYETEVREPFKAFVGLLIEEIRRYEPDMVIKPSDAIFRINRDIRFSKDKTPYKTHTGAHISTHGKKDSTHPGLYIQLSPESVMIASGVYMPDKTSLEDLRYFIFNHMSEFKSLYSEPAFLAHFGSIKGEKQKRLPPDLKDAATQEPLLYNKQFYYETHLPVKIITEDHLLDQIMEQYLICKPLNDFFKRIL